MRALAVDHESPFRVIGRVSVAFGSETKFARLVGYRGYLE
jgi:hypothetical protein